MSSFDRNNISYESSMFNIDPNYNSTMDSDLFPTPELIDGSQGCKDDAENIHLKLPKPNIEDEQNNKKVSSVPLNNVQLPLEPIHSGSVNNILGDGDFYEEKDTLGSELMVFEDKMCEMMDDKLSKGYCAISEMVE